MRKRDAKQEVDADRERARLVLSSRRWFWASVPLLTSAIFISNAFYWPGAMAIMISFWQYYKATT